MQSLTIISHKRKRIKKQEIGVSREFIRCDNFKFISKDGPKVIVTGCQLMKTSTNKTHLG